MHRALFPFFAVFCVAAFALNQIVPYIRDRFYRVQFTPSPAAREQKIFVV